MFDALKNAINHDAHMYEINKEKLQKIYNLPTKKKRVYEIIEKKVIYAKEDNKLFLTKEDMERNYFSYYKYFREYLTTGFESEETKQEINEIKILIENSKSLRENLSRHFEIITNEPQNLDYSIANSTTGSILKKSKFINNFVKMCNLLQLKPNENVVENNPIFKLYSELNNPSDIYSFSINENFLANKLLSFKKKLTRSYYQEECFCNFAKSYYSGAGGNLGAKISLNTNESIPREIRQKFPIDYIDSIFRPRETESFYQLDAFMSVYGISPKVYLHEKDLYENIYGILSKCNYANFMSYLYSKNNLFKYIYNEFAMKKASLSETLENVNLSRIDSIETSDKFFRGEILISPKNKNQGLQRRNSIQKSKEFMNFDEFLANYFFDKICFITEKLEEKTAEALIKDNSSNSSNNQNQIMKASLMSIFKNFIIKDFTHLLLITKNEKIKINYCAPDDYEALTLIRNNQEIDDDLKKVQFHKIDKKFIAEKFAGLSASIVKEQAYKEMFSISNCIYILEVRRSSTKDSIMQSQRNSVSNNYTTNYYAFRISNEAIDKFELAVNNLKLFSKIEDRFNQFSSITKINESFSNNTISVPSELVNKQSKERDREQQSDISSLKDLNEGFRPPKSVKQSSSKQGKRISQFDEDYLASPNNDILNEAVLNKHVRKDQFINNRSADKNSERLGNKNQDSFINSQKDEEEYNNSDLRNMIHHQNQLKNDKEPSPIKFNFNSPEFLYTSPEAFNLTQQEIGIKSYKFKMNESDYKFTFAGRKEQEGLEYYKFNTFDDDLKFGNRIFYKFGDFKQYFIAKNETKNYHEAWIKLEFSDANKGSLDLMSYDKNEFENFIKKIDKYIKLATKDNV